MNGLFALAFTAGLVSPVNPCGFALLPAWLAYHLDTATTSHRTGTAARLGGGLRAGLAVTAGYAGTLTAAGMLITAGARPLLTVAPWLALAVGALLAAAGLAVIAGWQIPIRLPARLTATARRGAGHRRLVAFGAGYAIASLGCTIGLLLAVIAQALATANLAGAAAHEIRRAGGDIAVVWIGLDTVKQRLFSTGEALRSAVAGSTSQYAREAMRAARRAHLRMGRCAEMVEAAHDGARAVLRALDAVEPPLRADDETRSPAVRWAEATLGLEPAGDHDRHYPGSSVGGIAEDVDRFAQEVITLKANLLVADTHLDSAQGRLAKALANRDDLPLIDLAARLDTATAELAGCKEEINTAVRNAMDYIDSINVDYDLLWTDL